MLITLLALASVVAAGYAVLRSAPFGAGASGSRLQRIQSSPNWKNGAFQNLEETPSLAKGISMPRVMWEFFTAKVALKNPTSPLPAQPVALDSAFLAGNNYVWFGHSSYALSLAGKLIVVDPVFGNYASPFNFGTRAFTGVDGYAARQIPGIDLLLITHDHYDHLDHRTIRALLPNIGHVVCPLGVGAYLERWGVAADRITELDWHERTTRGKLDITAVPSRHFSGRGFVRNTTLWSAFAIQAPGLRILVGGDSGYGNHFAEIGRQYGPFDWAILENGQYDVKWPYIHMLPEELPLAAADLRSAQVLPVHNSKFALAQHAWFAPMEDVLKAGSADTLRFPEPGRVLPLDSNYGTWTEFWWRKHPDVATRN